MKKDSPSLEHFELLALTFQALSDPTRLQLIWRLRQGDKSVTQLGEYLGVSQPAVSHHLRMLRTLRLVRVKKVGRVSQYSLDDEHISNLLQEGLIHVKELL